MGTAEAPVVAATGALAAGGDPFAVTTVTFGAPPTGLITVTRLPAGTTTTWLLEAIGAGATRKAIHGTLKLMAAAAAAITLAFFLLSRFLGAGRDGTWLWLIPSRRPR